MKRCSPYLLRDPDPRLVAEIQAEKAAFYRQLARDSGDDVEIEALADLAQLRAEEAFR